MKSKVVRKFTVVCLSIVLLLTMMSGVFNINGSMVNTAGSSGRALDFSNLASRNNLLFFNVPTPTPTPGPKTTFGSITAPGPNNEGATLYSDTFGDNVIGANWSTFGGTWVETNGILSQTSTNYGFGFPAIPYPKKAIISNNFTGFGDNYCITAKVRVNSWTDGYWANAGVGIYAGTDNGYGYNLVFNANHSTVSFLDDGVSWGPSYTFTWTNNTWYWFKLKMEGTTLYGKVWQDGTTEPASWPYQWTGRTSKVGGYPSLNGGNAGDVGQGGTCNASFDDVSVKGLTPAESLYISDMQWMYSSAGDNNTTHRDTDVSGGALQVGTATYTKGIGTHAFNDATTADVTVNISGLGYKTFSAYVGIDETTSSGNSGILGSCEFVVFVDGKERARSRVVTGTDQPVLITADVTGGSILKLSVTNGGVDYTVDWADWCNAMLTVTPFTQMLSNSSFEDGSSGNADVWVEGTNHSRSSDRVHSGSWALKSTFTGGGGTASTTTFFVSPGTYYKVSGWIYKTNNNGNAYIDLNDISGEIQMGAGNGSGGGVWSYLEATWYSNYCDSVKLRCITDTSPTAAIWFDDVKFEKTNPVSALPTPVPVNPDNLLSNIQTNHKLPFSFIYNGVLQRGDLSTGFGTGWTKTFIDNGTTGNKHNYTYTYVNSSTNLTVTANICMYTDSTAVDYVLNFKNNGASNTPLIEAILPLDMNTNLPDAKSVLYYCQGSRENIYVDIKIKRGFDFQPYSTLLYPRSSITLDSENLDQSSCKYLPYFNLEYNGGGLIGAIGWTGNWNLSLERDLGTMLSAKAGQTVTRFTLTPGESIRTPSVVLMTWSGNDRMQGHNNFKKLEINNYLPRDSANNLLMTPISAMTHMAFGWGSWMNEANSIEWIDILKGFGGEAFWLDAGWYGDIWKNRGSFDPEPIRFPNGLGVIGDYAASKGEEFIVWFDEECVMQDTSIYQQVEPSWLLHVPTYSEGKEVCTFDFGNATARAWLLNYMNTRIADNKITILRHDCCSQPLVACFSKDKLSTNRWGITENHYIEGLYAYFDAIRSSNKNILIDNCSGGGRRLDIEMMKRSLPLWQSDAQCFGTNPPNKDPNRMTQQPTMDQIQNAGLSLFVPLHSGGVWNAADKYWWRSQSTTGVCLLDLLNEPGYNLTAVANNVAETKALRPSWLGNYYPLTDMNLDETKWCGWQFDNVAQNSGFITMFRRTQSNITQMYVRTRNINTSATYTVTIDSNAPQSMSGSALANLQVNISTCPGSTVIKYVKQ